MSYDDFTLSKVKKELGIEITEGMRLFDTVEPIASSSFLLESLRRYGQLATLVNTEKARSEFLIAPILGEIVERSDRQVSLFSGRNFTVDVEKGLQGFCDFILSRSPEQIDVAAPVMTIVEAKNESISSGLGQCMAEMIAAQMFNAKEGTVIEAIYGAVTTGTTWRFLRLIGTQIWIDDREYFINELDHILGILMLPFSDIVLSNSIAL
jgi:hypothetical protein